MLTSPIVVGVDTSAESLHAAVTATRLAAAAGVECRLITAVPDVWSAAPVTEIPFDVAALNRENLQASRDEVRAALNSQVDERVIAGLEVRLGRPQRVLEEFAAEMGAGLMVLGGKHHPAIERWLSGSTAHHVLRKLDIPVLAVDPRTERFAKILVSVDLSYAARPTLEHAEELARVCGSTLRFLHVVEPAPITAGVPFPFPTDELVDRARERVEKEVWPLIETADADTVVRRGSVADTVSDEAKSWGADVVVMGSHGKGWIDRILLGSTTERLLNNLPASLLVIPTSPS